MFHFSTYRESVTDGPTVGWTDGRTDRQTNGPMYKRIDRRSVMRSYSCRIETKNLDCKRKSWNILLPLVQQPIRATYRRINGPKDQLADGRMNQPMDGPMCGQTL